MTFSAERFLRWFGGKGCTKILSYVSLKQICNIIIIIIIIIIMITIHILFIYIHTFSRKSQTLGTTIYKGTCNTVPLSVCFSRTKVVFVKKAET